MSSLNFLFALIVKPGNIKLTVESRIPDHLSVNLTTMFPTIAALLQEYKLIHISYTSQLPRILTASFSCNKAAMVGNMEVQFTDRCSGILDWTELKNKGWTFHFNATVNSDMEDPIAFTVKFTAVATKTTFLVFMVK